jgi:TolA-binding protein
VVPKQHGPADMRLILRRFTLALVLSVLGSPGSVQADAGGDPFAAAAVLYDQQHWPEACDAFGKLLAEQPDHPRGNEARFFYGEALAQLSRWPEARAQFDELRKRDPDHRYARQALFRGGEAAYLGGDDQAARRDLQAFRERFPQDKLNGYVLPYLASLELQAGNVAPCQRLFTAALEQYPDGPLVDECRLGLAETHEKLHALEQARRGYRAIIESNSPLSDQALLHLGAVENALGEHASAVAALERLAVKFPDSPLQVTGRLERGYALYKLGRYREAEVLLQDLVDKPAVSVEAYYWLGLSLKARKQWSEAARALVAGGQIDQHHRLADALGFQAGDALLRQGQYAPAREQFQRVLKTWPQSPWADDSLLGQVRVAYEQNAYDDCVRLAEAFAKQFPDSTLRSQSELAQGRSLLALQKYAEAVDPLEKILKRKSPQAKPAADLRADAQAALAVCYAKLSRWAEAKQMLAALHEQKARGVLIAEASYQVAEAAYAADDVPLARDLYSGLAQDEQAPDMARRVLPGLGWCYFKSGNLTEAASAFGRLLNQYPDSPSASEAALMRGRALEQLNQLDPALAMYYVVIEQYPHDGRVAEALWRAARLHDQLQQRTQAIELYAKLVKDHPDFAELDAAIYCWAWLLRQSDQVAAADDLFARLRRDFPQSHFALDATLRLAERAIASQNYDDAEKLLSEVTQAKTPAAARQHAWYLQGRLAMARQQWSAVDAPLVQLIENFPDSELALPAAYLMAEASYRQGHFEKAAQRLADLAKKTAGRSEPYSATAELRRAQALAQLKDWTQALEIARAMPQRFPDFEQQYEVDYLIGRALAAQAEFAGAREAYARVIESPRGSHTETAAMARWMIGESYFHQEDYGAALAEYSKVDEQYMFPRWQAAALLQAGKCHELLGEWRLAVEVYGRLIKTFPQSDLCAEATRRSEAAGQHASSGSSPLK